MERMAGHDALPVEWRKLSCLVHGRYVEFKFKRHVSLARAEALTRSNFNIRKDIVRASERGNVQICSREVTLRE